MIYFDNAATTFPKPAGVVREMKRCMDRYCGNPGRSSHKLSVASAAKIYECRVAIAELFGTDQSENVVFTYNTTYALNMAIKSVVKKNDHVLISDLEHNSVLRPVTALHAMGLIDYDIFSAAERSTPEILSALNKLIQPTTRAIICTHVSNVCGITLPIEDIGRLCKEKNITFIVDAAQSAGIQPIDVKKANIGILCAPGHKALYGPQGTGFAIFSDGFESARTLIEGGNGVNSIEEAMPDFLPERFEAGTLATPAIAGLLEGVKFVRAIGFEEIQEKEQALALRLADILKSTRGVTLYAPDHIGSTLLFNIDGIPPNKAAALFDDFDICLRGGLHCSPLAHAALGTGDDGALRASLGFFNNPEEIEFFYKRLKEIIFTA